MTPAPTTPESVATTRIKRHDEAGVVVQEVAGAAEPAEEGGEGEAVERGDVAGGFGMRVEMAVAYMSMAEVTVAEVETAQAAEGGEEDEDESEDEADEIDGVHLEAFLLRGLGCDGECGWGDFRYGIEDGFEAVDERGGFEDGFEQQEAAAGVFVVGEGEESAAELGVAAAKRFGSGDEPEVELVFDELGGAELGLEVFGVVDEVAGVDLEEAREQQAGGVGEVGAGAGFDLREVGLGDGLAAGLVGDGADELLLGHGAVEAAEGAFDFAEVTDFVGELHGRYCDLQYVYYKLRLNAREIGNCAKCGGLFRSRFLKDCFHEHSDGDEGFIGQDQPH